VQVIGSFLLICSDSIGTLCAPAPEGPMHFRRKTSTGISVVTSAVLPGH
jgi:hypothetical protein